MCEVSLLYAHTISDKVMSANERLLIWRLNHTIYYEAFVMPLWIYALYDFGRIYLLDFDGITYGIAYAMCFALFELNSILYAFFWCFCNGRNIWLTHLTICYKKCKKCRYDITFHRSRQTWRSIEITLRNIGFQDTAKVIASFLHEKYFNIELLYAVVDSFVDQLDRVGGDQSHE